MKKWILGKVAFVKLAIKIRRRKERLDIWDSCRMDNLEKTDRKYIKTIFTIISGLEVRRANDETIRRMVQEAYYNPGKTRYK